MVLTSFVPTSMGSGCVTDRYPSAGLAGGWRRRSRSVGSASSRSLPGCTITATWTSRTAPKIALAARILQARLGPLSTPPHRSSKESPELARDPLDGTGSTSPSREPASATASRNASMRTLKEESTGVGSTTSSQLVEVRPSRGACAFVQRREVVETTGRGACRPPVRSSPEVPLGVTGLSGCPLAGGRG